MLQANGIFPSIAAERLAGFKQTATEISEIVRGEPGTLQQDWFLSADETRCVVRETYADSAAALAHVGNVGPKLMALAELGGGIQIEIFGRPNDELAGVLAGFGAVTYEHFRSK